MNNNGPFYYLLTFFFVLGLTVKVSYVGIIKINMYYKVPMYK